MSENSSLKTTLYMYVKDYIFNQICSGKYPANSKLPSETEMMNELDVGRATVRAAITQLESEGIVYKKQGSGTYVCQKSRNYGLEPFISLSMLLKKVGSAADFNIILEQGMVEVDCLPLLNKFEKGTKVCHVKRLRMHNDVPLAIENNYFPEYVYNKIKKEDFTEILAYKIISNIDKPINYLDTKIIIREPSEEEVKILSVPQGEKVLDLTRWLYFEGIDEPLNFVHFVTLGLDPYLWMA